MYSIGFVATQVGVSVSTVRKWETRYGFPKPLRTSGGTRKYSDRDVELLIHAKSLLDAGQRAEQVFASEGRFLVEKACLGVIPWDSEPQKTIDDVLSAFRKHDYQHCFHLLSNALAAQSALDFVEAIAAPLMQQVGVLWAYKQIGIFEEHAISRVLRAVLEAAIKTDQLKKRQPVILLLAAKGDLHTLGLMMVHAALAEAGARCINLDGNLPTEEIFRAVNSYQADIVAISAIRSPVSSHARNQIEVLSEQLPENVEIWIGGTGAGSLATVTSRTVLFDSIRGAVLQLSQRGDREMQRSDLSGRVN